MRNVSILGSTGSIGRQALEIVRRNPDRLSVCALAASTNIVLLEEQIREFAPALVCVFDEKKAKELAENIKDLKTKVVTAMDGLIECACTEPADTVLVSVVGMIGVRPVIEAIKAGKDIALANKESLVTAGHIIMPLVKEKGVKLLPVDSEHSAIFQCLRGEESSKIEKILLTASGGPFRGKTAKELEKMTAADALKHPNWSMGSKITIDSSTLVNKGLEVCEVKWLFDVDPDNIEVVVQPQSILHSAVQFSDGAIIGQMGIPDMKLPIQFALLYPERCDLTDKRVDLFELKSIYFEKPDTETFRALPLAYRALRQGGNMPTVYNAANEEAVAAFLKGGISFGAITDSIEDAMSKIGFIPDPSLEAILETEKETRAFVRDRNR
jgi:1-deoxy-D-xylulose-5-phosphate reductoisomerase